MNYQLYNPGEKSGAGDGDNKRKPDALSITIVTEDLRPPLDEGAKKTIFCIIRSLAKLGCTVSVYTQYENASLEQPFLLPGNKFLFGYRFCRHLRAQTQDCILYIPASSGTIGAFFRAIAIKTQSFSKPMALMCLQFRKLPAFTRYLGFNRYIDLIFTQSQTSSEVYQSIGCKTILLPGGVDKSIFKPVNNQEKHGIRRQYGLQESDQIVLHVGHCNRGRNLLVLTRLARLGFRVILIASMSTAIDQTVFDELEQAEVIVITDYIENIQHYYQMADCYLFPVFNPSSAIDAPLSVLEAMACNLPVVTTRFGALPGMFRAGNGLYFGNTDEQMVSLVQQAVEEDDCRTFAMISSYSWEYIASTISSALQNTLNL